MDKIKKIIGLGKNKEIEAIKAALIKKGVITENDIKAEKEKLN